MMNNLSLIKRQIRKMNVEKILAPYGLEIGCGPKNLWHDDRDITMRIDCVDYGQQIIWNVEEGIPLPDNSCKLIYSNQVFEHFDDIVGVFNECWRVLQPEGLLHVIVPHRHAPKALLLSHTRIFDKYSFDFLQYESYSKEYQSQLWKVITSKAEDKNLVLKAHPVKT